MPVNGVDDPVEVVAELFDEPALADPTLPDDGDEPHTVLSLNCGEHVLEQAQVVNPSNERRLDALPNRFADGAAHSVGAPRGDRDILSFHGLVAELGKSDGVADGASGCLSNEDRARIGDRLQPRCGVDHVADDEALLVAAGADRRFSGEDADPNRQLGHAVLGSELGDRIRQLQPGAYRTLGIVLVGDRCTPHSHHRVADELVNDTAEGLDHVAGSIEIPGEEVANLLRVTRLGEWSEPGEVGKEHGDQAAFGNRRCLLSGGRSRCGLGQGRATAPAETVQRRIRRPAVGADHLETAAAIAAEAVRLGVLGLTNRAGDHDDEATSPRMRAGLDMIDEVGAWSR